MDRFSPASFDSGFYSQCGSRSPSSSIAPPASDTGGMPSSSLYGRARSSPCRESPCSPPTAMMPVDPLWSLATFMAEMAVWLWFEVPEGGSKTLMKERIIPSERFLEFCHKVVTTTQVSQSVVMLALLFIARLKAQNDIHGALGSEFRMVVTALMMSNKVLDDNTYTAKTWADVSSLELAPLVAGEAEFLRGLDWKMHVDQAEFDDWIGELDRHIRARNDGLDTLRSIRRSDRLSKGSIRQHEERPVVVVSAPHAHPQDRPVTRAFAAAQQQQHQTSHRMSRSRGIRLGSMSNNNNNKRAATDDCSIERRSHKRTHVAPPTPRSLFGSASPAVLTPASSHSYMTALPFVDNQHLHPFFDHHPHQGLAAPFSPYVPVAYGEHHHPQLVSHSLAAGSKHGITHAVDAVSLNTPAVSPHASQSSRPPATMVTTGTPFPGAAHPHHAVQMPPVPVAFGRYPHGYPHPGWHQHPSFDPYRLVPSHHQHFHTHQH